MTDIVVIALSLGLAKNHMMQDYQSNRPVRQQPPGRFPNESDRTVERIRKRKKKQTQRRMVLCGAIAALELPSISYDFTYTIDGNKLMIDYANESVRDSDSHLFTLPELKSNLYVSERIKPLNEQIYYLVDNINTAINRGKQISFRYFHYDQHRKEVPNNDGKQNLSMGDAEYLKDWLQEIATEGESKDDVKTAQELLKRMAELEKLKEYKPLAKVEELEESNYNMIDNVLNNGAGSEKEKREESLKQQSEQKKLQETKRPSLKERLEEKKALVAGKDTKAPEKTIEKNVERVL